MAEVPIPIWEEWNFLKLASRLRGTEIALREIRRRGEAGAIAGWAIYKNYIENLIRLSLSMPEKAYRTTMINDLRAVGEDDLIEKIEDLHAEYPEGVPTVKTLNLVDEWDGELSKRVGRRIPRSPNELTIEEIEESKRITRELYEVPRAPKEGEGVEEEIRRLEEMRGELEERLKRLRRRPL